MALANGQVEEEEEFEVENILDRVLKLFLKFDVFFIESIFSFDWSTYTKGDPRFNSLFEFFIG